MLLWWFRWNGANTAKMCSKWERRSRQGGVFIPVAPSPSRLSVVQKWTFSPLPIRSGKVDKFPLLFFTDTLEEFLIVLECPSRSGGPPGPQSASVCPEESTGVWRRQI